MAGEQTGPQSMRANHVASLLTSLCQALDLLLPATTLPTPASLSPLALAVL